jgi:uncharacterized protein YuzE
MAEEKLTELFYDQAGDVLYLSVGKPRPAISQELGDDVLLRVDPETHEIVGLTVFNLATRFGDLKQPKTLPVHLDFHPSSTDT